MFIDVVGDVVSLVNKFSNNACAVAKTRSDLTPLSLDFKVDIVDVLAALGGFSGDSYASTPPAPNPCP